MSLDLEKGTDGKLSRAGPEGCNLSNTTLFDAPLDSELSPQETSLTLDEPDWPTTWRAYTALLGCFFLMFNSWGIINAYGSKCP